MHTKYCLAVGNILYIAPILPNQQFMPRDEVLVIISMMGGPVGPRGGFYYVCHRLYDKNFTQWHPCLVMNFAPLYWPIISAIQLIKLWETNLPSPDEFLPCNVLVPYTRAASVTKWHSTESMHIANYSCHCLSLFAIWNACVLLNKSPGILYGGMGDCNSIFILF